MSAFANTTLLITGGTGSFGHTVLKHFLETDIGEIRIFSRDEKKQDDMRHELQARHPEAAKKVKFYIGDVRNPQAVRDAMPGVDYIFHAAALKQVPSCEFFPMEAVRTNVMGTDNVLHAAIEAGVKRVVCLSTDKAAYPINAMGISKAMMERVIYANARVAAERGGTVIACTRYGNVMCSPRLGDSAVHRPDQVGQSHHHHRSQYDPLPHEPRRGGGSGDVRLPARQPRRPVHPEGGRLHHRRFGKGGAESSLGTRAPISSALATGRSSIETLMTREERLRSEDMGNYFRVAADNRDLNYDKFVVKGQVQTMADESYTSHNTIRLDVEGTVKKLLTTDYVKEQLKIEG